MKTEQVIEFIVNWLKEYQRESGLKGFVAGVSGGIDSAVTSTLCAKTGAPVIVLNMPIRQDVTQFSLAKAHIGWLKENFKNVEGAAVDLTAAFQAIEAAFPAGIQDGLTMANTRARLRMLTLYGFAGHRRMLVTGTGNKVEDFGVGFFTKYGDGGVDICPIADLMKSEVYAIGRSLGVIDGILRARPTDGLWGDNRTDEEQIGASYDELEWAMGFEEAGHVDEIGLSSRQREVLDIFRWHHRVNRHKMEALPVARIPGELK
ncbi:MAG: NAD(+) synthase [Desulfobacteraceae bacterium]|nr:NAD(+) synthase [Desulfobacteraceae bacterium]